MYIWNIKALKNELAANALTESQVFVYFLAVLTLETSTLQLASLFSGSEDTNIWDYADIAGSVVLTVGGTLLAYRMNGGSSGRFFLARYFPLMWVLTVRFLVFMLPVILAAMALMYSLGTEATDEDFAAMPIYAVIASWLWFLVFYYRLAVHMRDVALPSEADS